MKRIEPEWLSYRAKVVPAGAGPEQVEECRRAFYAGAVSLFKTVMTMLDPDAEPTEQDIEKMADLQKELMEFGLSIEREHPNHPKRGKAN